MTTNNHTYCRNGCGQNRPSKGRQESKSQNYPVNFERASNLRDRELIERSYAQIGEINGQLIHSRLEIIVRPKAKTEVLS
jgi:hypothetical protein